MYGISSKNYSYYVLSFENEKDAEKWLNDEEYDFRTRKLYPSLSELIKDNEFVRESLEENMDGDPSNFDTNDYIEALGYEMYENWMTGQYYGDEPLDPTSQRKWQEFAMAA